MAKKAEVSGEIVPEVSVPSVIDVDFGREDLNALRDAVNFLLTR